MLIGYVKNVRTCLVRVFLETVKTVTTEICQRTLKTQSLSPLNCGALKVSIDFKI